MDVASARELHGFEWRFLRKQASSSVMVRYLGASARCQFSPDGKRLAALDNSTDVIGWRVAEWGQPELLAHSNVALVNFTFVPGRPWLALVERTESHAEPTHVQLWDYEQRRLVREFVGADFPSVSLAISPDGQRLAIGGGSGKGDALVSLVALETGERKTISANGIYFRALAFSGDSRRIACGRTVMPNNRTDTLLVFDVETGQKLHELPDSHTYECCTMATTADGNQLVTSGYYGKVLIYDWSTLNVARKLLAGPEWQTKSAAAITGDGRTLIAGMFGQIARGVFLPIYRWTGDEPAPTAELTGTRSGVQHLSSSADGRWLAALDENSQLHVWNVREREWVRWLSGHGGKECWSVAFAQAGKRLVSSGDDHLVRVWDAPTGRELRVLQGHKNLASCTAVDPAGKWYASGDYDGRLIVWDAETGSVRHSIAAHQDKVRSVAFSIDGRRLASGGKDGRLHVWDVGSGECLHTLAEFEDAVRSVSWSLDGRFLAATSTDKTLVLLDAESLQVRRRVNADAKISALAFTWEGDAVLYGTETGKLTLLPLWKDSPPRQYVANANAILAIAVSPDGRTIAVGGEGPDLIFWHRETAREVLRFPKLNVQINSLAFDPSGNTLAAALHDGRIALWEALPAPGDLAFTAARSTANDANESFFRRHCRRTYKRLQKWPTINDCRHLAASRLSVVFVDGHRCARLTTHKPGAGRTIATTTATK